MHQAARLQFGRVMDEFARWRAVLEVERSPVPAWWWGAAMAVLDDQAPMARDWCGVLGLRDGSSHAEGARIILALFASQTALPWPGDFPRKTEAGDRAVRELHPQPSDDGAFQP